MYKIVTTTKGNQAIVNGDEAIAVFNHKDGITTIRTKGGTEFAFKCKFTNQQLVQLAINL